MLKVRKKETASMLTQDGVRLDADIYRPNVKGEFPVLLMRQPYGRAIASTVVYAHPTWYAAHGYIVVIQDVRGRGTSKGEFKLFSNEIADSEDAVNWAAKLPGSNEKVGMYGFSYQGMTQLYAAATKPPALKTICPAMIGYDLYADWAYEGGAFCLAANLGWAIQIAAETSRLRGDETAYQALFAASRNLPLNEAIPANPEILKKFAPDSFYHEWLAHPKPCEYWEKLSPKTYLQDVDLPMLHIGGWFDTFIRGTIHLYKEMAARSTYKQHLIIGPWAHLPWCRKVGAVDYGKAAESPIDCLQIRWFDQILKNVDTGLLDEPQISLFEMGSNKWRLFDSWPGDNHKSYFLATTGLGSIRESEGKLTESLPQNCQGDVLVHDPWRPVPALGGHAAMPSGSFEQSPLDYRSDIVTYTTEPLTADLHLAGDVAVEIYCTADSQSHDLCAVLSEVHPNGNSYNLTQGYLYVESSQQESLRIQLQATCVRILQGNALRLSLSAACFPAYPVNPGTNKPLNTSRLMDAGIITLTVNCGGDYPSQVFLPVVSAF